MSHKSFLVRVDFEIKRISCPGVWLCSNGQVSLQLCMLESCVQTKNLRPIFPVRVLEKFTFYKTFHGGRLVDLQEKLSKEWFYVEFIQWENDDGSVLAYFQTTLDELLYPSTDETMYRSMDLDLLMEPTQVYPGTLAPKVLVKTRTTIEESLSENSVIKIHYPKVIVSSYPSSKRNRAKRVCHSLTYNRSDRCWSEINKPKTITDSPTKILKTRSKSCESVGKTPRKHKDCSRWRLPENDSVPMCKCKMENFHCEGFCPTCYHYKNMVSESRNNLHKPCACSREIHKSDMSTRRLSDCGCPSMKTPSILARRLHERLTECLCHNANQIRTRCNDWINFD